MLISVNVTSDLGVSVGLDPRWQKGWYRLASALEGLGMLPEAEIALDTGLPLDARCCSCSLPQLANTSSTLV